MSQKVTVLESNYDTLIEAVAGALDGKEDQLLSLDATGKAVLFDGTRPATHVMIGKLQAGEPAIRARILGKNGTVRVIQDAAIVPGARVSGKTGTARVETATAGKRALGFKMDRAGRGNGAAGDVIEIFDLVEGGVIAPSVVAAPAAAVNVNGAIAALNSTAVNPTKADFDAALAALETLADDTRAAIAKQIEIHTALVAQGIVVVA